MPMRGLVDDVSYLHSILASIDGTIVVAGHSYGGSIISDPDALTPAVRALVFVAAFQQDTGETAGELNYRFPGSRLIPQTTLVREYPGGSDMYLRSEHFAEVYAADVDPHVAAAMAAAQHPIDPAALNQTFTGSATWRSLPSWTLVATADHSVPTQAQTSWLSVPVRSSRSSVLRTPYRLRTRSRQRTSLSPPSTARAHRSRRRRILTRRPNRLCRVNGRGRGVPDPRPHVLRDISGSSCKTA